MLIICLHKVSGWKQWYFGVGHLQLTIGGVQNLVLELETRHRTELFRSHQNSEMSTVYSHQTKVGAKAKRSNDKQISSEKKEQTYARYQWVSKGSLHHNSNSTITHCASFGLSHLVLRQFLHQRSSVAGTSLPSPSLASFTFLLAASFFLILSCPTLQNPNSKMFQERRYWVVLCTGQPSFVKKKKMNVNEFAMLAVPRDSIFGAFLQFGNRSRTNQDTKTLNRLTSLWKLNAT